ncbi:helix-turn-helix domain-containing protein [Nocardioides sp.]|uniref:helix-turn-helix domain-containing protein n=1 Tax=Nocardioides sp. TaxID=35761 RepID=UPI0035B3B864
MDAPKIWAHYVRTVAESEEPGSDQAAIAARVGVSQGTVSRWLGGRYLPDKAAVVAAFAKAYGHNVLEAFVAAGMLTELEAGRGLPATSRRFLQQLSEGTSTVYDAMAAHPDQGDIAGEQDRHHET